MSNLDIGHGYLALGPAVMPGHREISPQHVNPQRNHRRHEACDYLRYIWPTGHGFWVKDLGELPQPCLTLAMRNFLYHYQACLKNMEMVSYSPEKSPVQRGTGGEGASRRAGGVNPLPSTKTATATPHPDSGHGTGGVVRQRRDTGPQPRPRIHFRGRKTGQPL